MLSAICLAAFALAGGRATAGEVEARAAAARLAESAGARETIEQNVEQMIRVQITRNPALAPQREALSKFFGRYMGWDSVKPELTRLYMQVFSERELVELAAFYASPIGRKARLKLPELEDEAARLGMGRLQEHMGEFVEMTRETPPPPAPPPAPPWRGLGPRP